MEDEHASRSRAPASRSRCSSRDTSLSTTESRTSLSTFERIISSHPPIFESLLLQLPTSSILDLYHTSQCLRLFLQRYPTAWKHLSFRSLSPGRLSSRQASPASDGSGDSPAPTSKPYSLDLLLSSIVVPFGTRLKSLELDHTAISGHNLAQCVLHDRRDTLQHLSVRGCKQVSLKYHIVPFLNLFSLQRSGAGPNKAPGLALKSLYTFRCRHHRRRPYTTASRTRKDSDSAPTHDLIQLCHELGIWTDTAWCPTPGGRCLRRKDYSVGRGTPEAKVEVWVVFDRLWRSGNRLGPSTQAERGQRAISRGQLWEDAEIGVDGEPLGCEPRPGQGEGKGLPTHLRQSHNIFIQSIKCYDCGVWIQERCEHCSIRMHCMGCRKTLCQNCAFSRPLPTANNDDQEHYPQLWWAPSHERSPNIMMQEVTPTTNATSITIPNSTVSPAVKMQWCCLRPMFSNGGSITFVGPDVTNSAINHVRAAPLPRGKGYEDAEFLRLQKDDSPSKPAHPEVLPSHCQLPEGHHSMIQWLLYGLGSNDNNPCPRSLCPECYQKPGWRAACQACKEPFCFAHDFRGLNMRICGSKDLAAEKAILEGRSKIKDIILVWEKTILEIKAHDVARAEAEDNFHKFLRDQHLTSDSLNELWAIVPSIMLPLASGDELRDETENLISRTRSGKISIKGESLPDRRDSEVPRETFSSPSEENGPLTADASIWRGCGSFMCPKNRSIGDHRPMCTAHAQQCGHCDVHICPKCLVLKPACDCSHCKDHYCCPNCFHRSKDLCKKAEEEEEKRRREKELARQKADATRKLKEADEAAEVAGEFLSAVHGDRAW